MKTLAIVLAVLLVAVPVAYHLGSSHGFAKANTQWSYMVQNDGSGDSSLQHSVFGVHGYAYGSDYGRMGMQKACSNEIIKITSDNNAPRALGEAMVDGFVDPSDVTQYAQSRKQK